jgi:uncharacterized protein (DUF2344 family)
MGRYMTVELKDEYKTDVFIKRLNEELLQDFGSNNSTKFNPWNYLQEEADYITKWLIKTRYKYLDKSQSENYSSKVIRDYLDYIFEEACCDMKELWKIPK